MAIPVEAKNFTYTPDIFKGIEGAPVFTMRYGTRRDRHTYQDLVRLYGLRNHDEKDLRDAIIDELRAKYASDEMPMDVIVDSVERYYSACQMFNTSCEEWKQTCRAILADVAKDKWDDEDSIAKLPPPPELEFDKEEATRVENLIDDVEANSERIRRMNRDNGRREREVRRICISVLLKSCTMEMPLYRDFDKIITQDSLFDLEEALEKESIRLGVLVEDAYVAFFQLGYKASAAFFLEAEEEKNFASLPSIISDQNGSMQPEPKASTSKASAKSPTPEASSTKLTPELSD